MTVEKCSTCEHAFTTGKGRWYCEKSLADKDDCGEYKNKQDDGIYADSDRLPPCRVRDDIPDFYRK